ncbi:MAG: IclR family transcriptional regulator [Peptococcaceae bacterium]|nr:IclR family transcriptional regulator [Peptococcaceae bacterium]
MSESVDGMNKYYIMSVLKSMDVLGSFITKPEWSISELSNALNINRSTVNRLLITMSKKGFVKREYDTGKYSPGLKVIEVAQCLLDNIQVRKESTRVLKELAAKSMETIDLAIWDNGQVLFIDHLETPNPIKPISFIGRRIPAHSVSCGKIFLAYLSPEELSRFLSNGLEQFTPNTITDPDKLTAELDEIRRTGIAYDIEERFTEISACSAAIRDERGKVVAALSIVGPSARVNGKLKGDFTVLVKDAAERISQKMGYKLS